MPEPPRGILPILYTPFDDAGKVSEADLLRLADHLLACGAHGLAVNGEGSECHYLTLEERRRSVQVILAHFGTRVPILVGVSARDTATSVALAREAEDLGAAALFGTPPLDGPADPGAIRRHYLALDEAVSLPLLVQRSTIPIPASLILNLGRECRNPIWVKEETPDLSGHNVTELIELGLTVFSGARHLLDELARGARGALPGSVCVADQVQAYEAFARGDHAAARRHYNHALPLLYARRQAYLAWSKEVLRREGLFQTARVRQPGQTLDAHDLDELTRILEAMGPPYV